MLLHFSITPSALGKEKSRKILKKRGTEIKLLLTTSSIFMSYNLCGLMGQNSAWVLELSQPMLCISEQALSNQNWRLAEPATGDFQMNFHVSPSCLLCPCPYLVCYIEACTTDKCILEWHHADGWGGILIWPSKQKKGSFNSSTYLFSWTALDIYQQSFVEFGLDKFVKNPFYQHLWDLRQPRYSCIGETHFGPQISIISWFYF